MIRARVAHDPPLTIVVLPLLNDGADALTVDPALDDEPEVDDDPDDDEESDAVEPDVDEPEIVEDVAVVVLEDDATVARPAYVCSASRPTPPTATVALARVERSTRVRRRSARSRRMIAAVSEGVFEFMPFTVRPCHVPAMETAWEAAGEMPARSECRADLAEAQGKRRARGSGAPRVTEQGVRHRARGDNGIAPVVELDQLGKQLGAHAMSVACDAVDDKTLLGHLTRRREPRCSEAAASACVRLEIAGEHCECAT